LEGKAEGTALRNYRPYYSIEVSIGDVDLSMNLSKVRISGSIDMPYQAFLLSFKIDSVSLILDKLYSQKDIRLKIIEMTEDRIPKEIILLDLFMIYSNMPLYVQEKNQAYNHPAAYPITLLCLAKSPFKNMTSPVNKIYDEKKRLTPVQVVQDIIGLFCGGMGTDIKTNNQNNYIIPQLIVKGMNFVDCVRYLDGSDPKIVEKYGPGFGLYNGPLFFMCRYDNIFTMWDLKSRIGDSPEYLVYHLAGGADDNKIMEEVGDDNTNFYSYGNLDNVYKANKNIMKDGYEFKFMSKPLDKFYNWINITADSLYQQNSPTSGGAGLQYVNESIKGRTAFLPPSTGTDYNDTFLRSKLSSTFTNSSEIRLIIPRQFAMEKLVRIGVPIEVRPQLLEYGEFAGRYIVKSSDVELNREGDMWFAGANITAMRGNATL
jgi:hypothetical protein